MSNRRDLLSLLGRKALGPRMINYRICADRAVRSTSAEWVTQGGHRTLAEKAFAALHAGIVTGGLTPGQRLRIEELAELLEMSPMPIREALRRLDSVGLVEHVPHRGARVAELSVDDLREVYEARLALEPLAVNHAAERFTDEDAELAGACLARLRETYGSDDVREAWSAHTDFHFALYRAAGSRWLLRLITPLWESSERYRIASLPMQRGLDERRREHERILDACVRHDSELAALELHNHLALTANQLSRGMGGGELFELRGRGDGRARPARQARFDQG
jgi:DNA-binding GntR family transcriptional regulator